VETYHSYLTDQNGVALMMVLWIMVFLTVIVTEFAFSMRTEVNITQNFKEETQSYYLAQAGIALALTEILASDVTGVYLKDDQLIFKHKEQETPYPETEQEKPELNQQRQGIPLGPGTISYQIKDEQSKINLNSLIAGTDAQRDILNRLLNKGAGMEMGTERDIIVDSILDWMDKDDLHKLNGAEDDYYHGLDPAYDCKDGPFDTVDELLLVRGVTKQILYGNKNIKNEAENQSEESKQTYPGIAKFLSVWGGRGFNSYTAEYDTLEIQYGEEKAQEIAENIASRLEDEFFTPPKSTCYSIVATGKSGDGSVSRSIFAVVKIKTKDGKPNIEYQCWNDNLVEYQFINISGEQSGSNYSD
jgi:general secretion pathway protein K